VVVLREAVARGTHAPADEGDAPVDEASAEEETAAGSDPEPVTRDDDSGSNTVAIVGASALGALGVAGVVAAIIGMAGSGECLDMVGSTCVEERGTNWAAVGVYGGLGIAAIAAAVVWLVVGMSSGSDEGDAVAFTADGVRVAWDL